MAKVLPRPLVKVPLAGWFMNEYRAFVHGGRGGGPGTCGRAPGEQGQEPVSSGKGQVLVKGHRSPGSGQDRTQRPTSETPAHDRGPGEDRAPSAHAGEVGPAWQTRSWALYVGGLAHGLGRTSRHLASEEQPGALAEASDRMLRLLMLEKQAFPTWEVVLLVSFLTHVLG